LLRFLLVLVLLVLLLPLVPLVLLLLLLLLLLPLLISKPLSQPVGALTAGGLGFGAQGNPRPVVRGQQPQLLLKNLS